MIIHLSVMKKFDIGGSVTISMSMNVLIGVIIIGKGNKINIPNLCRGGQIKSDVDDYSPEKMKKKGDGYNSLFFTNSPIKLFLDSLSSTVIFGNIFKPCE